MAALLCLSVLSFTARPDVAQILLEFGANIEGTRPNGTTVLLDALVCEHLDFIKVLLAGANVEA